MSKLNYAIAGFGKMGMIRYNTLKEIEGCSLKRICDPFLKNQIPAGVECGKEINDVINDKEIDFIVVSTPNNLLKDVTVRALDAGKHVFCEKPPGRNLSELKAMIDAEKRNPGKKLMFGFNHRHHESMIHAKKLIDSGEYGKVLWLRGARTIR
jgi:1,5-anhydro-D-fructose reductase (1,5-anhydro-D-mannitol-forming)